MESGITFIEWANDRFDTMGARIKSNHDSIRDLRAIKEVQGNDIIRLEAKIDSATEDIEEIKGTVKWIFRGLFASIAVGISFTAALLPILLR